MGEPTGSRTASGIGERAAIDTRALAAFRIVAGAVVLADLALRASHVVAFYTDSGVLPRSLHAELFPALHAVSIHAAFGSAPAQGVLFAIAGVAAVALLVGYRTTPATAVSTYLLISLQFRNPLVLTAGDLILSALLFFGTFLPLGARYSLDAVHAGAKRGDVSGIRTLAPLVFVVVLVYATNAITHLRSEAWTDGTAVRVVFGVDSTTVFLGEFLSNAPAVLVVVNWIWLGLLVAAPLLILSSGWFRSLLACLFFGAHLGILFTLYLFTFPLANCAGLLLFVRGDAWDRISGSVPARLYDALGRRAETIEHGLYPRDGQPPRGWRETATGYLGSVAVVVLLLLVASWAVVGLDHRQTAPEEGTVPSEYGGYAFAVFSPEPLGTDGRYVAPATLESGLVVDAYRLTDVGWDRPPDRDRAQTGPRWTTYTIAGQYRVHAAPDPVVEGFARYLCLRASDHYAPAVENVTVYFLEDGTGNTTTTRRRLTRRACR